MRRCSTPSPATLDETMLAALAQAYAEGRLLLIGTTDLDAQQPVIWNIGAIAASDHPRALDTIRRVLLASAAIPGAFPPTMFDVTAGRLAVPGNACRRRRLRAGVPLSGRHDGAAPRAHAARPCGAGGDRLCHPQRPARPGMGAGGAQHAEHRRSRHLDHDRRERLQRRSAHVQHHEAATTSTSGWPISAPTSPEVLPEPFDQGYMRALFDYGYQRGRRGYDWASQAADTVNRPQLARSQVALTWINAALQH